MARKRAAESRSGRRPPSLPKRSPRHRRRDQHGSPRVCDRRDPVGPASAADRARRRPSVVDPARGRSAAYFVVGSLLHRVHVGCTCASMTLSVRATSPAVGRVAVPALCAADGLLSPGARQRRRPATDGSGCTSRSSSWLTVFVSGDRRVMASASHGWVAPRTLPGRNIRGRSGVSPKRTVPRCLRPAVARGSFDATSLEPQAAIALAAVSSWAFTPAAPAQPAAALGPHGAVNPLLTTTFACYQRVETTSPRSSSPERVLRASLHPLITHDVRKVATGRSSAFSVDRSVRAVGTLRARGPPPRRAPSAQEVTIDALYITVLRWCSEVGTWAPTTASGSRLTAPRSRLLRAAQPDLPGGGVRRRGRGGPWPERRRRHARPHHDPDRQPVGAAADPGPRQGRERGRPGGRLSPDRQGPGPAAGAGRVQRDDAATFAAGERPAAVRSTVRSRHGVDPEQNCF